jgi:hypothetical protein
MHHTIEYESISIEYGRNEDTGFYFSVRDQRLEEARHDLKDLCGWLGFEGGRYLQVFTGEKGRGVKVSLSVIKDLLKAYDVERSITQMDLVLKIEQNKKLEAKLHQTKREMAALEIKHKKLITELIGHLAAASQNPERKCQNKKVDKPTLKRPSPKTSKSDDDAQTKKRIQSQEKEKAPENESSEKAQKHKVDEPTCYVCEVQTKVKQISKVILRTTRFTTI